MWNSTTTNNKVIKDKTEPQDHIPTANASYDDIIGSTIGDFEKLYPELAEEFQKVQQEQYELFASKMLDYGLSNISLGSDLSTRDDKNLSLTGIWLRCNDKINRLKNMLKRQGKNYVQGEAMIDSFIDIANYGIIAMLVMRNKWK